jgi:sugar transferase (PEP-CTERM system associated)
MGRKEQRFNIFILMAVDASLVILAFVYANLLRFGTLEDMFTNHAIQVVMLSGCYLSAFYIFDLYEPHMKFKNSGFLSRLLFGILLGFIFSTTVSYTLPYWYIGRGLVVFSAIQIFLYILLWRSVFDRMDLTASKQKVVLILGAGRAGYYTAESIRSTDVFQIAGFLDDDPQKHGQSVLGIPVIGRTEDLARWVEEKEADIVVVAITHEKKAELLRSLLDVKLKGIEIYDVPTIYEEMTGMLPVSHLRDGWIVFTSFSAMNRNIYIHAKRVCDVFIALLGLVLSAPIIIITAILIKLTSPGPVFFRQKRVGLNEEIFTIYKFRSMVSDAEKNGAVFAQVNDSRITPFGSFMRKSRIDEIPQLWNVIRGDMSFVGPRPERPEFVYGYKEKIPYYSLRHIVKPGLTGWAQVKWRYGASEEDALEKLKYDMFYLKNISFMLDLQIVLKTINVVISRELSR